MIKSIAVLLLLSTLAPPAEGVLSCEALKAEIAAKLDAKGVPAYTLVIVDNQDVRPDQAVVGRCGGGRKKIIYRRGQQV